MVQLRKLCGGDWVDRWLEFQVWMGIKKGLSSLDSKEALSKDCPILNTWAQAILIYRIYETWEHIWAYGMLGLLWTKSHQLRGQNNRNSFSYSFGGWSLRPGGWQCWCPLRAEREAVPCFSPCFWWFAGDLWLVDVSFWSLTSCSHGVLPVCVCLHS